MRRRMNLIGPELVGDLVSLVGEVESGQDVRVLVLERAQRECAPRRAGERRPGQIEVGVGTTPAVLSATQVLNELTRPRADAIRADARRLRQLWGQLELDLGDRVGAL